MKQCSKCKRVLPVVAFHRNSKAKDGLKSACRECGAAYYAEHCERRKAYAGAWYAEHCEERKVYSMSYRAAHREEMKALHVAYRAAHPERVKARRAAHYVAHREEIAAHMAAYYVAHREELKARRAAYYVAHREEMKDRRATYRAAHREEENACRAARRKAYPERDRANGRRRQLRKLSQAAAPFGPWMCSYCLRQGTADNDPDGQTWHIDHVIALANGGPHHPSNQVLACQSCNLRKHAQPVAEWLAVQTQRIPLIDMLKARTA